MVAKHHENRRRAESFGEEAERYDRARPSYPAALVDELLASKPARVLDVGCGTGKVARLFLARAGAVLGVERAWRMAAWPDRTASRWRWHRSRPGTRRI